MCVCVAQAMMHGECVAAGCVAEAEVARRLGQAPLLTPEKVARIAACFASYGLPVHVSAQDFFEIQKQRLCGTLWRGKRAPLDFKLLARRHLVPRGLDIMFTSELCS